MKLFNPFINFKPLTKSLRLLHLCFLSLLIMPMSKAQIFCETDRVIASDPGTIELFGKSVSISGDVAIVGADRDGESGLRAGAAYIFARNQGGSGNWGEVKKLLPAEITEEDKFGSSVSMSGDIAIVGAPASTLGSPNAGVAFIFAKNEGGTDNWGVIKRIQVSDPNVRDQFGISVSIDGDLVVVGASLKDAGGAAYIFARNEGGPDNWGEVKKIIASDMGNGDLFGTAVAIYDTTVVVGAPRETTGGFLAGAGYIFSQNTGGLNNWGEVMKVRPSNNVTRDFFGLQVTIYGDEIVIGKYISLEGSAVIFSRNEGGTNNWGEVKILQASDKAEQDRFGSSATIYGDLIVVGAEREDTGGNDAGAAYVFARNEGGMNNWGEVQNFQGSATSGISYFGGSISLYDESLLVGSIGDGPFLAAGGAYFFELVTPITITDAGALDCGETFSAQTEFDYTYTAEPPTSSTDASQDCSSQIIFGTPLFDNTIPFETITVEFSAASTPPPSTLPTTLTFTADNGGFPFTPGRTDRLTLPSTTFYGSASTCNATTQVTYTVTNTCGAVNSCEVFIEVTDNQDPQPNCNDITVRLGTDGTYRLTSADEASIGAGSTDNCGINPLLSGILPTTYTMSDIGPNLVTYNLTDYCGNSTACIATVNVLANNDRCIDAILIACGDVLTGSTIGAINDAAPFCGTSNTAPGVWYSWMGTGDCVNLTTCSPNTNYDTKLTVYTGTCEDLICVGGDDDDGSCDNSGDQSTVDFVSTAGTNYYILVHGIGTAAGNFELTLTCTTPPANDLVCGAFPIPVGGSAPADGSCASVEPGEPSPGAGTSGTAPTCNSDDGWCSFEIAVDNSLWYVFTAPASGKVSIETIGSGGDTQLALWEVGDCSDFNTFTEIRANDDGGAGFLSLIDMACVIPGNTYYIQVDGFAGNEYNVNVELRENLRIIITCPDDQLSLSCNNDLPVAATTPDEFTALGGTISAICTADPTTITVSASDSDNGGNNCSGNLREVTRTYTVSDGVASVTCEQIFRFTESTQGPIITSVLPMAEIECADDANPMNSDIMFTTDCSINGNVTITGPTRIGPPNCPGTIYQYTYTVTDDCLRTSAPETRDFVINNVGPTITGPPTGLVLECGHPDNDALIIAHLDNISTTSSCGLLVSVTNSPETFNLIACNTTTLVTFEVTDNCLRTSTATTTIQVIDTTPPAIACPAEMTVSCDADHSPASTGSATGTDACDTNVSITSSDVSTQPTAGCFTITRTWVAEDNCGNTNSCVQIITVEDTQSPVITCPPSQTLNCNSNPFPLATTIAEFVAIGGMATDNCSSMSELTISFYNIPATPGMLNFCSANPADRTMTRTHTITDACGNATTCTQDFIYNQVLNGPVITEVPLDQTVDCAVNAIPQPWLFTAVGECSDITYTVSGPSTPGRPGCSDENIRYTYSAMDECGRSASHTQIYTLANEGPEFVCPSDICVIECPADTDMIQAQFDNYANLATVITSCEETGYSVRNDFTPNGFTSQNCMNPTVAVDNAVAYQIVKFTATDDCGREGTCTALVVLKDNHGPVMNGTVSFGLADCADDDLQAGYTAWATSQLSGLSATDDCAPNSITLSYSPLSPNVDCASGVATTVVSFIAADGCGNETVRMVNYRIIDNGTSGPTTATISGNLITEEDEMVSLAEVTVEGVLNNTMTTSSDGYYHFNLEMAENYTIAPSRNDDPLNGVTTYDLILIGQHILGMNELDSPYKIIAADVNESGDISNLDLIEIRQLILMIRDEFSTGKSWTFVDAGFNFPQPTNPFATTFPTVYNINDLSISEVVDFVGVKLGDVNASTNPALLQAGDTRSGDGALKIRLEDQLLKAGQIYELEFGTSDFAQVAGFQFTLDFAAEHLSLVDYTGSELKNMTVDNFGFTRASQGQITVSWNEHQPVSLMDHTALFKFTFKALADGQLSELLTINSSVTAQEAYQADLYRDVVLDFGNQDLFDNKFKLLQNRPNPFMQETVIGFQLPERTEATLTVFDVAGRVVLSETKTYDSGLHQVRLNKADVGVVGILYYQLVTSKRTVTKKMIILE